MEVVTTTSVKYADVYGFTEDEVFSALDEYGLSDIKDKVKHTIVHRLSVRQIM